MSRILSVAIAALFFAGLGQQAFGAPAPLKEKVIGVNDAFIPDGFDSETDAFAVVSGLFPNGCYSYKRSEVSHDMDSKVHEVRTYANVSEGMCIMVLVPFTKEVRLGQLPVGENSIRFINGDGTYMEKKVIVE